MKKRLIFMLLFISVIACKAQLPIIDIEKKPYFTKTQENVYYKDINNCSKKKEIVLIEDFLKNVIHNEKSDFVDSQKYIGYSNLTSDKEKIFNLLIKENIKMLREELNKEKSYEILSHKEALENKISLNFSYNNYSKVYYLVGDNKNIITTFVVDSNKIISFSYNLIKNKNRQRTPFLLNKI